MLIYERWKKAKEGKVFEIGVRFDDGATRTYTQESHPSWSAGSRVRVTNGALGPIFGPGKYMAFSAYTDIYLAPGVLDRLKADAKASAAVLAAVGALPGIAHAFRSDEISDPEVRTDPDPVRRAAALGYHPARSGDLIIVPREHWILSSSATTHGTLYPYDQRVPVIFFGAGVKPGEYTGDVTPADVAPTLAALAHVAFKKLDGQVLTAAVAPRAGSK